jgi:O-antigen ligase
MPGFVEQCNRIVRWGLLALIVFTPLASGTAQDWSIAVLEWGVVTLCLVFVTGRLWPTGTARRRVTWPTGLEWPFGLFLLFCLCQTVPLPMTWLSTVSPGSARLYSAPPPASGDPSASPASAIESGPAGDSAPLNRPVSLRPVETLQSARLTAVFMIVFLLVAWWADRGERIIYLVTAITMVGFLAALQGLIQFMTGSGTFLWFRPAPGDRGFGLFMNHNHFAGYVEMIIPLAIGLSLYLLDRRRHPPAPPRGMEEEIEGDGESPTIGAQSLVGHREKGFLSLFAAVILVVSLFFSMSRGGILSALVSGVILLALLWNRMISRRIAWSIVLCLPLLIVALVFWIGPAEMFEKIGSYDEMGREVSFRARALVWKEMVRNVDEFAWTGAGLGAFEATFAPFTPPGTDARWHRAHNDYLQLFWETGAIGMSLFLAGGIVYARRYWWPALRSRAHPLDVIRIGAAVSLMSIAAHSLVDFNLQIGSNGFLFALLAGLLAALTRAIEGSESRADLKVAAVEGEA